MRSIFPRKPERSGSPEATDPGEPRDEAGFAEGPGADGAESMTPERERDFFDLEPEEMRSYRASAPLIGRPPERRFTPLAAAALALVVVVLAVVLAVVLWPSSGARVPSVVGKMLADAIETARARGFSPIVAGWEYSDVHTDGVILAQSPAGGGQAIKGTEVKLTVSKGPRPESESPPAAPSTSTPAPNAGPLAGRTVCVDPGHQSRLVDMEWIDPGLTRKAEPDSPQRGASTGNAEYVLTLDIAMKLKSLLEKDGIAVVLTRDTSDIDLPDITRAQIANTANADLYVRIHFNYSENPEQKGTATLYPARNTWTDSFYERSKTAALYIQEELTKSCGTSDLGIFARDTIPGFNWSQVPVVEPLPVYLSNPEQDEMLTEDGFRWKIAWGIRDGIQKYMANR